MRPGARVALAPCVSAEKIIPEALRCILYAGKMLSPKQRLAPGERLPQLNSAILGKSTVLANGCNICGPPFRFKNRTTNGSRDDGGILNGSAVSISALVFVRREL